MSLQDRAWEGPLFIVGMPRSGTKLLRTLLNQHPRVRIPDVETEFFPALVRWVAKHGPAESPRDFLALHAQLKDATYFDYRGSPMDWHAWRDACAGRFDAAGLFEGFMRCELDAGRSSGIVWGDKSPSYVRDVRLLLDQFPTARVVHIVRDVRDHCVSMRKAWNKDVRRAAWRWGIDVLEAHRVCSEEAARCREVKYEQLIAAPEETLRELCEFLGLDYYPRLAQLSRNVENLGDATGRTEIISDNARKYRTALSPAELEAVEALAWEAMRTMGYVPERARGPKKMSLVSRLVRKLRDGAHLVVGDVERRGLARSLRFHLSHQRTISR
jgi:hypothetical protein